MPLLIRWLPLVLLGGLLSACTGMQEIYVSRPVEGNNTSVLRTGKLESEDIRMYIRPRNLVVLGDGVNWFGVVDDIEPRNTVYWKSSYYQANRFYVEIYLEAKRSLAIDLTKILLSTNTARDLRPKSYLGPLNVYSTANYALSLCRIDLNNEKPIEAPMVLTQGQSMCIALVYYVEPPSPTEKFQLEFSGLEIGQKKMDLAPILFDGSRERIYVR